MAKLINPISRRKLLATAGLGTSAFVLSDVLGPNFARAEGTDIHELPLLIFCEFSGGWDTMVSLDPRDHSDPKYSDPNNKIQTGYDLVADADTAVAQVLASTGNTGLITPPGSNVSFGPAMEKLAKTHFEDLCVIRGVDMGTLSHAVGRRYFITGKFPRGLAPSGSSLPTWWSSENAGQFPIPNLASRTEAFNEGLDPRATALKIGSYGDLEDVLKPLQPELEPKAKLAQALAEFQYTDHCLDEQIDVTTMTHAHHASFEKSLAFSSGSVWEYFDFKRNPEPDSAMAELYAALEIDPTGPFGALNGPKGQAAVAAQALTNGLSQAVSIELAGGLDTHSDNWAADQASTQRAGWEVLSTLISYLKNTLDVNGKPFWDRTTIFCYSDFARTPKINQRGGRDHFLYSSTLIAGPGIKGNQAIGASNDYNYSAQPVDVETGAPDPDNGVIVRPPDVHATVLESMGLSSTNVSNQSPVLIKAALK